MVSQAFATLHQAKVPDQTISPTAHASESVICKATTHADSMHLRVRASILDRVIRLAKVDNSLW
jgi:hypothetical protein